MSLACRLVCSAHTGRDACLQKRRPRVTCAQCWSIHSDEIQRWKYITPEEINEFRCSDGLLNEFKMFYHLRHRFPLHYLVFKQIACHVPHEANVEQYFSRAGLLSDPHMDPG